MDCIYHLDYSKIVELSRYSTEDWFKQIDQKYRRIFKGELIEQSENISNEEFEMLQGVLQEQFKESVKQLVENIIKGDEGLVQQIEAKLISLLHLNDALAHFSISKMREYKGFIHSEGEPALSILLNIIFYTDNPFLLEKVFQFIYSQINPKATLKSLKLMFKNLIQCNELSSTDIEFNLFTTSFFLNPNPFKYLNQIINSYNQGNQYQNSSSSNQNNKQDHHNLNILAYTIHRKKMTVSINIDDVSGEQTYRKKEIFKNQRIQDDNINQIQENVEEERKEEGGGDIQNNNQIINSQQSSIQQEQQEQQQNHQEIKKQIHQKKQINTTNKLLKSSYFHAEQLLGKNAELQDIFRIAFIIKIIRQRNSTRGLLMNLLTYSLVFSEKRDLSMNIDLVEIMQKDQNCYVPSLLFFLLDDSNIIRRESKSLFQALICNKEYQQSLSVQEMKRFVINTIETDHHCFKYIDHDLDPIHLPYYMRNLYTYLKTHKVFLSSESELFYSVKMIQIINSALEYEPNNNDNNNKVQQIDQNNECERNLNNLDLDCIQGLQSYLSTPDLQKQLQLNIILPLYCSLQLNKQKLTPQVMNKYKEAVLSSRLVSSIFETKLLTQFHTIPSLLKFYILLFLSEIAPNLYIYLFQTYQKKILNENDISLTYIGNNSNNFNDKEQSISVNDLNNNDETKIVQQFENIQLNQDFNDNMNEIKINANILEEYSQMIQKLSAHDPFYGINKITQLNHLNNLAKQAKMNNINSYQLFRLTNKLFLDSRLSYLQIQNQMIIISQILANPSKNFRSTAQQIFEKITQIHSGIYEEMKKRVWKLQAWELNIFNSLVSFNNDLLDTSNEKILDYLVDKINLFTQSQQEYQLVPLLLLSCKLFQRNTTNEIKDDISQAKETIFFAHFSDLQEISSIYFLLNVQYKGHLRSLWNYYSKKYPQILIREISILNFIRFSDEKIIQGTKGLNKSQKDYFMFLKRNMNLFSYVSKDLDLRLSSEHNDIYKNNDFPYLNDLYKSTTLFYQIMSQDEFNPEQKSHLLISFFESLSQIHDQSQLLNFLLNKRFQDNVSKIIQSQIEENQELLIKVLNIIDNTKHECISEFKINLLIQIDYVPLVKREERLQLKDRYLLFQYLDLVFYDSLLAVEMNKKSKLIFDDQIYENLSDQWLKKIEESHTFCENNVHFRKNKISLIYKKLSTLENTYNLNIYDFKEKNIKDSLSLFKKRFNFKNRYPQFHNKFESLIYYGIMTKYLILYGQIDNFQIIKNAVLYIINNVHQSHDFILFQFSHIWKICIHYLCQRLEFDFNNLEVLIDLEKQIQIKLPDNQKSIMSFNDQIAFFLRNVKVISFSEASHSDFLKVNCELKIKKLFYIESQQGLAKSIKINEIEHFLNFQYGKSVSSIILNPFTNNSNVVELSKPQEFHLIQSISNDSECKKSLQECNSITTKLMEWMNYFQEFSQNSDSAKKTIVSLFEVLKIICSQYPLAVQHIFTSNFHVKLLDITHSLQSNTSKIKKVQNLLETSFSPFQLSQDYAFYQMNNNGQYQSSSLCLKSHLIQHLIEVFQQECVGCLKMLNKNTINIYSIEFENIQNKCFYLQSQIIQVLVDIPKNVSLPISLQILSNCEILFQKYYDDFLHLTYLLKLAHLTLNFLLQSFYPDSLFQQQNLLKLRYHQFLSFNQAFKEKDEILKKRERLSQNRKELQNDIKTQDSMSFLQQDIFSKLSSEQSSKYNNDSDERIEESKIQDIDGDQNEIVQNHFQNQQLQQQQSQINNTNNNNPNNNDNQSYLIHSNVDQNIIDSQKHNFSFNYDLFAKSSQISSVQQSNLNGEKYKIDKCIQEIFTTFPVFKSIFFQYLLFNTSTNETNKEIINQLLISLMNHPWNCMQILTIIFRDYFQNSIYSQQNILYNSVIEIALKNTLIHYPLSKGYFCKKTNQIILGDSNQQIDLTQNIEEMEQVPLIQILLRSTQFSKIQEHVWMIIKNNKNTEFPSIYQNVVMTQNLVDMVVQNIPADKLPQIIMNLTENQSQIIDVVKHLTVHLEDTKNSNFIYYCIYSLRKTLEKFIAELPQDEDALLMISDTLSPLRDWILSRQKFIDNQLTNILKKCTQYIFDQVNKFYPLKQEQQDENDIDLENVSKNFQVLWRIITNIKKEVKMDIQALAEINLILNFDNLETGQLPIMRQRKVSNEVSLDATHSYDKKNIPQIQTNVSQYHNEDEFSEDFLISKLASMNEITKKGVNFDRKIWEFFEQISETLGPEIIGRDVYIHLLNLLKPQLKKQELMRHVRSIVYGNQFTFIKQSRQVSIIRDTIWPSTIQEMSAYSTDEWLRAIFTIKFKSKIGEHLIEEIGIDAGGLKNHWISKIVESTFLTNKSLFSFTSDKLSVYPSKYASSQSELDELELLGKFVGKSMMDDWPLMVNFAPFFVKSILKRELSIGDFYSYDYQTAQQHQWLLENDIDNLDLGLTFSYTNFDNGSQKVIDLKKDGQNIDVDDSNKKEYIQLYCKAKMQDEIALQTEKFQKGLFSIIPEDVLDALEPEDFISFYQGVQNIDVSYLMKKMKYEGFKSTDKVIEWFWEILKEWDNTQKKRFLSALTEIPGIPVGGYPVRDVATGNVKQLTISYINCNPQMLPVWHTCFFRVDVPKYQSKEQMKIKLEQSINMSCGFHIA